MAVTVIGNGKVGNIQKVGDWSRAGILLRRGSATINNYLTDRIRRDADYLLEYIKNGIETNAFNVPPKKESTLRTEGAENDTPWIWTYELFDHIRVTVVENDSRRSRYSLFIGVPVGTKSKRTGLDLNIIAQYLEFGSPVNNQPPRPVFQPALLDNQKTLTTGWKKLVGDTVAKVGR